MYMYILKHMLNCIRKQDNYMHGDRQKVYTTQIFELCF